MARPRGGSVGPLSGRWPSTFFKVFSLDSSGEASRSNGTGLNAVNPMSRAAPPARRMPTLVGGGGGAALTVKLENGLDVAPPAVTRIVRSPVGAVDAITIVIGNDVAVPVPSLTVIPVPKNSTADARVRFVPLMTAFTVPPRAPDEGVIEVIVTGLNASLTSVLSTLRVFAETMNDPSCSA